METEAHRIRVCNEINTPEEVLALVRAYQPVKRRRAAWNRHKVLITALAEEACPAIMLKNPGYDARAIMNVLLGVAEYLDAQGIPVTRESILTRGNVDNYVRSLSNMGAGTAAQRRNIGYAVVRLLKPGEIPAPLRTYAPSKTRPPYSDDELIDLMSTAVALPEEGQRRTLKRTLTFGVGAGLLTKDLVWLTAGNVTVGHDGVQVHCSDGRVVPLLAEFENWAVEAVAESPDGFLLVPGRSRGNKNVLNEAVRRMRKSTGLPVDVMRCRSTWIVRHFRMGTPLPLLLKAAGLSNMRSLTRYMDHVPKPSPADERALLRGTGDWWARP